MNCELSLIVTNPGGNARGKSKALSTHFRGKRQKKTGHLIVGERPEPKDRLLDLALGEELPQVVDHV